MLGRTLLTRTHYLEAAERMRTMGPESVVLSLGSRGAIGAFREGIFEALPPRVDAVCPIGAGDALSAAYTWAMTRKNNAVDALRWGVAAGTASARVPGMKFATLEQTKEISSRWNCGVPSRGDTLACSNAPRFEAGRSPAGNR